MGKLAARKGDLVTATDTHIVMVSTPGGPVPTPMPFAFNGILNQSLSSNVKIAGQFAATQGSKARNTPPHVPQGGPFQKPPSNEGTVLLGSLSVRINGKPAARAGDQALTCNDPIDLPVGTVKVISNQTVRIGG